MTDLSQRYPTHPHRRRLVVGLVAVLAVLGLVWTLWTASVHSAPEVAGRVKSFDVRSDTQADAVVTVDRRDPAQPARCLLFTQAANYERVGEVTVEVPAGADRVTDVGVSIRTFRRATSVVLDRCEPLR